MMGGTLNVVERRRDAEEEQDDQNQPGGAGPGAALTSDLC